MISCRGRNYLKASKRSAESSDTSDKRIARSFSASCATDSNIVIRELVEFRIKSADTRTGAVDMAVKSSLLVRTRGCTRGGRAGDL